MLWDVPLRVRSGENNAEPTGYGSEFQLSPLGRTNDQRLRKYQRPDIPSIVGDTPQSRGETSNESAPKAINLRNASVIVRITTV